MQTDVRAVDDLIGQLTGDMRNLVSCADRIAAMWTGDAKDIYDTELRSELTAMNELIKNVQELNRGTDNIKRGFCPKEGIWQG